MARTTLTDDDQGKAVVNADGEKIGMVTQVKGGTAYVDPDPGITDTIRSKLGWGDSDGGDYRLKPDRIHMVGDEEIHLKE